jgi:hypothetical protein
MEPLAFQAGAWLTEFFDLICRTANQKQEILAIR